MISKIRQKNHFPASLEYAVIDFFIKVEMKSAAADFLENHPLKSTFSSFDLEEALKDLERDRIVTINRTIPEKLFIVPYGNGTNQVKRTQEVLQKELFDNIELILKMPFPDPIAVKLDYLKLVSSMNNKDSEFSLLNFFAEKEREFIIYM